MRIKLKSNEPFAMAGLWESWKSPLGNTIFSCTIITTKANSFMSTIHERMPLIVKPEDEKLWLNPRNSPNSLFTRIIQPYADDLIEAYEVSSDVNSTKNNNSDLIKEIS
nr:SOS response-associated peptidase family protein [Bacillus sp. AP8]